MNTVNHLDSETLKRFNTFARLSGEQRILLANTLKIEHAQKGAVLLELGGDDPRDFFLLEGRIILRASDGAIQTIDGGSDRARYSIANLRPSQYRVTALTPIQYVVVERELLQDAMQDAPQDQEGSAAPQMHFQHPLFVEFYDDLQNNRLTLPSLPEVAFRVRKIIDEEDTDTASIARTINADPAMAAKLVKAANSPFYRGRGSYDNCAAAITRLGLRTTRQLVISFAMKDLFRGRHSALKQRMTQVWQQSIRVAAISFVLARLTKQLDPEEAMTAGLLHNIGELPILSYAESYRDLVEDQDLLEQMIQQMRGEVGAMILNKWGFSPELVNAAYNSFNWHYDSGLDTPDYSELVLIAQLHSYIGAKYAPNHPRMHQIPAFGKLAQGGMTPEMSLQALEEAKDQIAEVQQLFQG